MIMIIAAKSKPMDRIFLVLGWGAGVDFTKKLMLVVYTFGSRTRSVVIFVIMLALLSQARYSTISEGYEK
jgi:regulator of extracellular matrix RemA (YlzA/DUF370 family)